MMTIDLTAVKQAMNQSYNSCVVISYRQRHDCCWGVPNRSQHAVRSNDWDIGYQYGSAVEEQTLQPQRALYWCLLFIQARSQDGCNLGSWMDDPLGVGQDSWLRMRTLCLLIQLQMKCYLYSRGPKEQQNTVAGFVGRMRVLPISEDIATNTQHSD